MGSIKKDLIGEQFVKGNIKNFLQSYHIYYYPPEQNFPIDKVWLYLHGKENGQPRMIRSLCFDSIETHRKFILNNLYYNLYLLEKISEEFRPKQMDIHTYRMKLLDAVFIDLRKRIIEKVRQTITIKNQL